MDPWYKVVTPRREVREGRSFNPDEFAIALEQVVAGRAPADYQDPAQFFSRTCFTRALKEHLGLVLRRLAGETTGTAPVLTLVTQFGGGKTHTLTALYHLLKGGPAARSYPGVAAVLDELGIPAVPQARVAVFVGNAWDPRDGLETPWLDIAWQVAGERGVEVLGPRAKEAPPGTEALNRLVDVAGGCVLLLFDEVLNLLTRHRWLAEPMHAFLHNIARGFVGSTHRAAVFSLPRSQVEMTDWELQWQERVLKVVGAVAKHLIVNDEAEIAEVVRRRLFEDLGPEATRKRVARAYADWCFERRAQLPPEWTAVDTATTEARAREFLRARFEACYPFHPATLSVFQRKWQPLPQYQQTRGTLAMLAQWVSLAYREGFQTARREPLITLGSAPLDSPEFRGVVLGQLGDPKLAAAIEADIAGAMSHARALDADTKGPLRDIHRRVGTAILFESSGGQVHKVAYLPELRFALGEPEVDTTSIDTAAAALEAKAFFIRRVGSDGYQISHKATLKKVVNDRRAALDDETEVRPRVRHLVLEEFRRGATLPVESFPESSDAVSDAPRLRLVVIAPEVEWSESARAQVAEWVRSRGGQPRQHPGALIFCLKRPGRSLKDAVEMWLAWERVASDVRAGVLGEDYDRQEVAQVQTKVREARDDARDEVWAGYTVVAVADPREQDGLKVIDLGAGHASSGQSLCGRILVALKTEGLLSESVGASYLERHWPPALQETGAWPLASLRQGFLDGSLIRLVDAEGVLRARIPEWVAKGVFGLAAGLQPDGTFQHVWFEETVQPEEVTFDHDVYLLRKERARVLKVPAAVPSGPPGPRPEPPAPGPQPPQALPQGRVVVRIRG
ncbi:MAG: DUF499 domain-containing protein, partial [Firmicutes bacterium]|nr:DUF499 domain-containing protein [Bacillota bacterium]